MEERLRLIEERYRFLESELLKPEIYENYEKMRVLNKEKSILEEKVNKYNEYLQVIEDIKTAHEMLNDQEMREFAESEIQTLGVLKEKLENEIKRLLLPKDPNDDKNVIVEIRGAAGGDEANIFAGDLFKMYTKYVEKQNWKLEVTNTIPGESGGYSQIEFMVKGDSAYSKLKYESGSHRVQRVPETETQGRIHTSTATVLVIPEAEDVKIDIKETDLRVDVCRSSGAGGQCVNTTDSAVRVTHIPTGIMVYCQVERSQIRNKERALQILQTKLQDKAEQEEAEKVGAERRSKIGTGSRSEKIRTYNYPQNRLTDHRINYTSMNLDRVMLGNLDEIIEALITEDERIKLESENEK